MVNAQARVKADTTQTVAPTLRTFALAALAGIVDDSSLESGFLRGYVDATGGDWLAGLSEYLYQPHPADESLLALADALGLSLLETLVVALCCAVEEEALVGRALAYLQMPMGQSRPTLALIASAYGVTAPNGAHPIDMLVLGAAVSSGVLRLSGDTKPLPEQTVAVPPPIRLGLKGYDVPPPGAALGLRSHEIVPLPPSLVEAASRFAASLDRGQALVIRTGMAAEGRTAAAVAAGAIGLRAVFIPVEGARELGAWLRLRGLVPVFSAQLAPGERLAIPEIPHYDGPLLVVCGPDGSIETAAGTAVNWTLPVPPREEREVLWQAALGNDELAAEMARHHRHSSGRIAQLGQLAAQQCRMRGGKYPVMNDVTQASRRGEGIGLDLLAQPVRDDVPDEALVIPPNLRTDLEHLLARCRVRDGLTENLGISAATRYVPGVRALFVGPSGTGKTLAAAWLATRLGLPLYRVDLASVTSKYIGETEKNLAQLLALAEQSEVVLLFDEADSMFAKRTDVKEANDRFANAQTNYLLQRIETYSGITLLTSNSRARFDAAFTRRLDLVIEFPLPGPEERRLLWQAHLGEGHALTGKELNRLAATVDLGGGGIRNAVLAAAVYASGAGRQVEFDDLVEGLAMEYRKLGKQLPVEVRNGR